MSNKHIIKRYFAVEVLSINGKPTITYLKPRNTMPLYVCCFGAGSEAQAQEEGCFLLKDARDRLWFCREVEHTDAPDQPDYAQQFFRMGYLAHKIGVSEPGLMFHGNADDENDLREQLTKRD